MSCFKDYATSVAFHVSFSQAQLEMIWCLHSGVKTGNLRSSITTGQALMHKGMVTRVPLSEKEVCARGFIMEKLRERPREEWPANWALTREGTLFANFLGAVGMFDQFRVGGVHRIA